LLMFILHFAFGNMFHTAKRGGDVGTYGSYLSQYGYALTIY